MEGRPLCLLALDGGGIRGLSELLILEEIMNRIKIDLSMSDDPLPADFFDLIGGTSTGGLIALLLGRVRLSVPEARSAYVQIAKNVFSIRQLVKKNKFDGRILEKEVKDLLRKKLGRDREEERMLDYSQYACKVFVCAALQQDIGAAAGPRLFRTYNVRENATFNCTIWEASRATSAAPTYFDSISIGEDGEQEVFVDGALGSNNPIEQVLDEARRVFPGRMVACIVSIGTGMDPVIQFPDSPGTKFVNTIKALQKMATESDRTAERAQGWFKTPGDAYFRFNVDKGLSTIKLEEWENLGEVRTYTTGYLRRREISSRVDTVVQAVLASRASPGQDNSTALISISGPHTAGTASSQGQNRTLPWRCPAGSLPSFSLSIDAIQTNTSPHVTPALWLIPFERNEAFVGRESALARLLDVITPGTSNSGCRRIAIEGLGGIGKTQIAIETAFRVRDQHPNCSVFWVPAIDVTSFENAYRAIGKRLEVGGIDEDQADVKSLVKAALSNEYSGSWLLIVDNADDIDLLFGNTALADYLPSSSKGTILFTTRNHEVVVDLCITANHVITIAEMNTNEALALLERHMQASQISDPETTTQLLELLAYLPLAIRQAAAYMAKKQISTATYIELCRSSSKDMAELLDRDFNDQHRYNNTRNAVATTWWISFQQIAKTNQMAAEYLKFMSFLAEKNIPQSLLPPASRLQLEEAIGTLKAYAFVTQRKSDTSATRAAEVDACYDIHRLVRLTMQNWLDKNGETETCVSTVIKRLTDVFPRPKHENRDMWVKYLPHIISVLGFDDLIPSTTSMSLFLHNIAVAVLLQGNYNKAEQLYRQVLILQTEVLGPRHPDTLDGMHGLANVLANQGNYEEAEQLYRQVLTLGTEVLGPRHPHTLSSIQGLAYALADQGNYKEAEQLYRQVLTLRTEVLGPRHPHTLNSIQGLANALADQGNYKEAEQLYRQVLTLKTKVSGPRHPHTLSSMHVLANVLADQGNYKEAEQLYRQVLTLGTEVLGPRHPDTLDGMHGLANVLAYQGNYKEAEQLYRQVLTLGTEVLGPRHPDNLSSIHGLAYALADQGNSKEAEQLYRQVLTLRTEVLGPRHPHTLNGMQGLANVLANQGNHKEAEQLYRQI